MARERVALETLFGAAPLGLALLDEEKRYVLVNERLARLNGIPVQDHIGRRPSEVIVPAGGAIEDTIEHVLTTNLPMVGIEVEAPTDPTMRTRVSLYPLVEGDRPVGVLGIAEFLDDQK